jgi:hypothetical protein
MELDHKIDSAFSQVDIPRLIDCHTFCGVVKPIPNGQELPLVVKLANLFVGWSKDVNIVLGIHRQTQRSIEDVLSASLVSEQELAARIKFLQTIAHVGDVIIPLGIKSDSDYTAKLTVSIARTTQPCQEFTVCIELLNVVVVIRHVNIARLIHAQTERADKLTVLVARAAPFAQELAVRIKL